MPAFLLIHHQNNPISLQDNVEQLYKALQHCMIGLLDNDDLVIVPHATKPGDVLCMFSGAVAPCLLRPDQDGCWALISGDCYMFGVDIDTMSEMDEYIHLNQSLVEDFTLR